MSQTVTVAYDGLAAFDTRAAAAACTRLGVEFQERKPGDRPLSVKMYDRRVDAEFMFKLPGWEYPVAVTDKAAGQLAYDDMKEWQDETHSIQWFSNHYRAEQLALAAAHEGLRVESLTESAEGLVPELVR